MQHHISRNIVFNVCSDPLIGHIWTTWWDFCLGNHPFWLMTQVLIVKILRRWEKYTDEHSNLTSLNRKKKKKKKIKCRTFSCKNQRKPELHPNIYISNGLKEESMTEQGKKIWWFYNKFKLERKKKERVVPCLQTLIGWVSLAHWCPHIYGTYMCNTTMKKALEKERERE